MNLETDKFEAFAKVTEGLENLDAYQQTRDKSLLKETETLLSEAVEMDPDYFKPMYLQAIVRYLREKSATESFLAPGKSAVESFRKLEEQVPDESVGRELSYNLAAALFSAGRYSEAIIQFDKTISESSKDLELNLLARAGAALAYATNVAKKQSQNPSEDLKKVEEHYRHVSNELPRVFVPELIRKILRQKPVDRQIASKVKEISERALQLAKMAATSNPDSPVKQEALG